MDNKVPLPEDVGLLSQLRDILRFLARKAFECMRWFLGLFNATTVLVKCTNIALQLSLLFVRSFRVSVRRGFRKWICEFRMVVVFSLADGWVGWLAGGTVRGQSN